MNLIKTLGLALLAALAATALLGASSAMAELTQLCKVDEDPCAANNAVTHVHEVTLVGSKERLLAGTLGTVECDVLFLGDSLGLAAPLVIHGNFTYSNCKRGTENCTVTEKSADALLLVLKEGHETASVVFHEEKQVTCGFFISCLYGGLGTTATYKGPLLSAHQNGDLQIEEQTMTKISGTFCPATAKLDILLTPLEPIYIAH